MLECAGPKERAAANTKTYCLGIQDYQRDRKTFVQRTRRARLGTRSRCRWRSRRSLFLQTREVAKQNQKLQVAGTRDELQKI